MDSNLGDIWWKILYNEEVERLPDVNKPENSAYLNATAKKKAEQIEKFVKGDGGVLFKEWQDRIRMAIKSIVMEDTLTPDCPVCNKILNIRTMANIITEAQFIIDDKK